MTITNDKRREVAQKLRELEVGDFPDGRFCDWGEVETALGIVDYGSWYKEADVQRLADLIEPEPERTCHLVIEDETGVCSNCGEDIDGYGWSYCPSCGAKVVG